MASKGNQHQTQQQQQQQQQEQHQIYYGMIQSPSSMPGNLWTWSIDSGRSDHCSSSLNDGPELYKGGDSLSADAYNHTEFLKSENNQNRDAGSTASLLFLICRLQQGRKQFILEKILKTADPFWCIPGGNDWWGEFQSYVTVHAGHAYHVKCGSNQSIEKMGPNHEDCHSNQAETDREAGGNKESSVKF